jgi:hypothetical protein
MTKILVYVALIALTSNCGLHHSQNPIDNSIQQAVLFHYSIINAAWGYHNSGWFIDSSGTVSAYVIPDSIDWHAATDSGPDSGYISLDALLANYAHAYRTIAEIQRPELLEKYGLIHPSAHGAYSPLISQGADMGAVQYFCYFWDHQKGQFKQVLLSLTGDYSRTNLASEAQALDRWLKGLNEIYEDSLNSR